MYMNSVSIVCSNAKVLWILYYTLIDIIKWNNRIKKM